MGKLVLLCGKPDCGKTTLLKFLDEKYNSLSLRLLKIDFVLKFHDEH